MLFLLKIAVTPVLVAAVSLAARWWGPTIGGLLMGLPTFTGPTLFVLTHDKGIDFGVAACVGVQVGVLCICAFMLAYGHVSKLAHWPLSLAAAVAAFLASALATQHVNLLAMLPGGSLHPIWPATGLALASLAVTYALLPRPLSPPAIQALPWWDIPMRMLTTAALVTALMLGSDLAGPQLSGVFATYPVILTVVGSFTHHRWGHEAVWRFLRGLTKSLFAFVGFFLVVGLMLPHAGLVGAYALALATALALTAALLLVSGGRRV